MKRLIVLALLAAMFCTATQLYAWVRPPVVCSVGSQSQGCQNLRKPQKPPFFPNAKEGPNTGNPGQPGGAPGGDCPPPNPNNPDDEDPPTEDPTNVECNGPWWPEGLGYGTGSPTHSYGPIAYGSGMIAEAVADFKLSSRGVAWEHTRYYRQVADGRLTITLVGAQTGTVEVDAINDLLTVKTLNPNTDRSFYLDQYTVDELTALIDQTPEWQADSDSGSAAAATIRKLFPPAEVNQWGDVMLNIPKYVDTPHGFNWSHGYAGYLELVTGSPNMVRYHYAPNESVSFRSPLPGYCDWLQDKCGCNRWKLCNSSVDDRQRYGVDGCNDPGCDYLRLVGPDGTIRLFYGFHSNWGNKSGKLYRIIGMYGDNDEKNDLVFSYDEQGRLASATDAEAHFIEYHYDGNSNISSIDVWEDNSKGDGKKIAEIVYGYMDPTHHEDCGTSGDLVSVTVTARATSDTGNDLTLVKQTHYRYYRHGPSEKGDVHDLRLIFRPRAVRRALEQFGTLESILAAADADGTPPLSSYASNKFEFDQAGRVSREDVSGGMVCCGGGGADGAYTYTYTEIDSSGVNLPKFEAKESRPDGSTKYVETNSYGQTMLVALYDRVAENGDPDETAWHEVWLYERDPNNLLITKIYTPSAINDYKPMSAGTRGLTYKADGDFYQFEYWPEDANKDFAWKLVQQCKSDSEGGAVASSCLAYADWEKYGAWTFRQTVRMKEWRVYPIATQNPNDTSACPTTLGYEFYRVNDLNTDRVRKLTITYPTVPTEQNGPGAAPVASYFYDVKGRLRWQRNRDGRLTYYSYDTRNGQLALTVVDVYSPSAYGSIQPGVITNPGSYVEPWTSTDHEDVPNEFKNCTLPPEQYVKLVYRRSYDSSARLASTTGADGQVTCYAYVNHGNGTPETRTYPAWGRVTSGKPGLPMSRQYSLYDSSTYTRWTEQADGSGVSFSDPPNGTETWPAQTAFVGLWKSVYDDKDRLTASWAYHDIPASGSGSEGTNYAKTTYSYQVLDGTSNPSPYPAGVKGRGMQVRQLADPTPNPDRVQWTMTVYNVGGDVTQIRRTALEDGYGNASDYKLVAEYFYGEAVPGNGQSRGGPLSSIRAYHAEGQFGLTKLYYDWREDLNVVVNDAPPHVVYKYDNLGQTVAVATYASVTPTSPPEPTEDLSPNRLSLTTTTYDNLGRTYHSEIYSIAANGDKELGGAGKKMLRTRYFYNPGSNLVALDPPNGGVTIYKYDGADRLTETWLCSEMEHNAAEVYSSGVFNYSNPDIKIVEKTVRTLNERGQATKLVDRELNHNDTDGMSGGDSDNIVTYAYNWYDPLGRLRTAAYYGTNNTQEGIWKNGSDPGSPSEPGGSSADVLVTKYAYDAADGRLQTVTDPKGIGTKYEYDDLGRVKAVVEDQGDAQHKNRRTEYAYDGLGNIKTLNAKEAVLRGGFSPQYVDEITEYVRADVVDANWVTKIRYPDPATGQPSDLDADTVAFTYNRDGTVATRRDQNLSTITYEYNDLRRLEHQRVTALGQGVDGAIRRITYVSGDTNGRLEQVISFDAPTNGAAVNGVKFEYDGFGKLVKDYQAHGGAYVPNTPYFGCTEYTYAHATSGDESSAQNYFNRLQTISYPNGRDVWYDYNHTNAGLGNLNKRLSRIGRLADANPDDSNPNNRGKLFAQYDFNGLGRLVQRDHLNTGTGTIGKPGNKTALRFIAQTGMSPEPLDYIGFDRFGRVVNLRHVNYNGLSGPDDGAVGEPVYLKYGYDYNSNRTRAENVVQRGFSHVYAYDNLNRLTSDKLGYYDGGSGGILPDWSVPAEDAWVLDKVGNWEQLDPRFSGDSNVESRQHNATNEIEDRTVSPQGPLYHVNDTFSNAGTDGWVLADLNSGGADGLWTVNSGVLHCISVCTPTGHTDVPDGGTGSILLVDAAYQDVLLTGQATLNAGCNSVGLVFGYVDPLNFWAKVYFRDEMRWRIYEVTNGVWQLRQFQPFVITNGVPFTMTAEVRSGLADTYGGTVPAGQVGLWSSRGTANSFDDFKVRSLAANAVVDGRFVDDVGNVRVNTLTGQLEFLGDDGLSRRSTLRHVRLGPWYDSQAQQPYHALVEVQQTWQSVSVGLILHYQDPENFGVALLDKFLSTQAVARYVESVDGRLITRASGTPFPITTTQQYTLKALLTVDQNGVQTLSFRVDGIERLNTGAIDDTWQGGCVGLYSASTLEPVTLVWDNFRCGLDTNADGTLDVVHADYSFDGTWNVLTLTHDAAGNLTADGLLKYEYDAWNRLVRARYDNAVAAADPVIATYEYDGLFRRIEKTVSNQGIGVVFRSDGGGALLPVVEGIQAGNRHEHYFYSGWRLVETTDHAESGGFYSYVAAHVLGQFAYGTQYIDEPVRYDRNTDPSTDDDCLDAGGSQAYYYHQDANYRVVMLTGEDGGVVERYAYTAYGEPMVLGGTGVAPMNAELGNAQLVSTVGNPFQHQGLFCDRETRTYQNRYRHYHARLGRFAQRDRLIYVHDANMYAYCGTSPTLGLDPRGLDVWIAHPPGGPPDSWHQKICVGSPTGAYWCYSFFLFKPWWWAWGESGTVGPDFSGGIIEPGSYRKTTPEQDRIIKTTLDDLVGRTYDYGLIDFNCRHWARTALDVLCPRPPGEPPDNYNPYPTEDEGGGPPGSSGCSESSSSSSSSSGSSGS